MTAGHANRQRAASRARPFAAFALVLALSVISGCGKYVPVKGRIVLDGKPMNGATVVFIPVTGPGGSKIAQTFTDADGRFALYTVKRQGALPGRYRVAITRKVVPPGVPPAKDTSMAEAMRLNMLKVETIPKIYTSQETTPLEIEVPKGGTKSLVIELKGEAK